MVDKALISVIRKELNRAEALFNYPQIETKEQPSLFSAILHPNSSANGIIHFKRTGGRERGACLDFGLSGRHILNGF